MTLYDEALDMLRRLEWAGNRGDCLCECPVCGAHDADGDLSVHDADCALMVLIRRMERTPMQCRPVGTADRVQLAEYGDASNRLKERV